MDKNEKSILTDIYREVGETKVTLDSVSKKLDNHVEYANSELKRINELDAQQNFLLDKHIEGVNTLKEMHLAHRMETFEQISLFKESLSLQKQSLEAKQSEIDERIKAIEKPFDLVKYAGKVVVWVSAVGTGVLGFLKALKWLKIFGGF